MADHNQFAIRNNLVPMVEVGLFAITNRFTTPTSGINNNQSILILTVPRPYRLYGLHLNVSASLGASATLRARRFDGTTGTFVTPATTAGGPSYVTMNVAPINFQTGQFLELVVGGANISAAAEVTVDALYQCL